MSYVKQVITTSPQRVEVWLNSGQFLAFVIHEGKFMCSAKDSDIGKIAYKEACRAAGQEFARQKKLQQQPTAA